MPTNAVSRIARAGWASGNERSWARMSGDASTRIQLAPSALTAMEDCVLGRALMLPRRKPSQLLQLQFHCGNPPPAADPRTRTLTMAEGKSATGITGRGPLQRVKTYIVISKPKRISVKLGFIHIMGALRGGLNTVSS